MSSCSLSAATQRPRCWPDDVVYISENYWSDRARAHACVQPPKRYEQGPPNPNVVGRKIYDRSHPAFGQMGLFALKPFKTGDFVINYVGNVVTDAECSADSDYTMRLRAGLAIDGAKMGNEARLINDYRGIGKKANVELRDGLDARGNFAMSVHALRDIARGEELLLSYGKGFWKARATVTVAD